MINLETYLAFLYAIIVPAIGVFIAINIAELSYYKKRDLLFVNFFSSFVLLILSTLIYCYGKYLYWSDLVPFKKMPFDNSGYKIMYTFYIVSFFFCTIFIVVYANIESRKEEKRIHKIKILSMRCRLAVSLFIIIINIYIDIWLSYIILYLLISSLASIPTLSIIITIFMVVSILAFIYAFILADMLLLDGIFKYLALRKIAKIENNY